MKINLPTPEGRSAGRTRCSSGKTQVPPSTAPTFNRIAYAAAHVVVDPTRAYEPWGDTPRVDWDATLAFRELSVWARIQGGRSDGYRATRHGHRLADRCRTDPAQHRSRAQHSRRGPGVRRGHRSSRWQPQPYALGHRRRLSGAVRGDRIGGWPADHDGEPRAVRSRRAPPTTTSSVYDAVISASRNKVVLHWLGEAFDASLAGYWGSRDVATAMATVLDIIRLHQDKIEGIKISLLNAEYERQLRVAVARGRRDVHRRRLQLRRTDRRRQHRTFARAAWHLRSDRAGGIARTWRSSRRATRIAIAQLSTRLLHCRANSSPRLRSITRLASCSSRGSTAISVTSRWRAACSRRDPSLHYAEVFRKADAAGVLIRPELARRRMGEFLSLHAGIENYARLVRRKANRPVRKTTPTGRSGLQVARSNRSRFITLTHAATKSLDEFLLARPRLHRLRTAPASCACEPKTRSTRLPVHFTSPVLRSRPSNTSGRRGWLPLRTHVEQVEEEVVGQRFRLAS